MAEELPDFKYGGEFLRPERDSYSFANPWGITSSSQAGTLNRLGRSVFGGPFEVQCSVMFNSPAKLVWWDDFYNYTIAEGSKRFNMELLVNGIIQTHVVQLMARPNLTTNGWSGTLNLSLQAVPIFDRCTAEARQMLQQCYGDCTKFMTDSITDLGKHLNGVW